MMTKTKNDVEEMTAEPLKSKIALDIMFDLAHKYIVVGDTEAGRQSLIEILEYGTASQKAKAKKLLQQLNCQSK